MSFPSDSLKQDVFSPTATLCVDDTALSDTRSKAEPASDLEKSTSSTINIASEEQLLSTLRKRLILVVLSGAQFFDIYNSCAAIIALPALGADLKFSPAALQWVLSAYTLTFAAFMLISGRLSDMFHPKPVFVVGFLVIGLLSIPIAASVNPIMTIVLRALQGIGAAMNVPSAVAMISTSFLDHKERGRAYAIYGAFGAIGNCLDFIIGGVISSRTSWRWVFYVIAILVIPFAMVSWIILPRHINHLAKEKKGLDWPGVFSLTVGLILFVFAISQASAAGWQSPGVIAPLILSVVMFAMFLLIERIVKDPALPPRTWTNKSFTPLFFYGWSVYWWLFSSELQLVQIFTASSTTSCRDLWQFSSLSAAVRCLPLGISGGATAMLTGYIASKMPRRLLLVGGQALMVVGATLFALADDPSKYWSHIVPGMVFGNIGVAIGYVGCTIVVMEGVREGEEGVVSAVMYTAYQIGATLGLASKHFDSSRLDFMTSELIRISHTSRHFYYARD
ncbi:major facilitator superfamily domain-containing protein [Lentinula aciculospora]|uniref:Major facilitator superfamily domain-containing protein n=1 Tax=Lentinula aciculospora TaxID=153920 RepID=A0A9W9AK33_9AGAR|nr:major facilitator superfamily domain-containing protein [Lentinula aciculospora]